MKHQKMAARFGRQTRVVWPAWIPLPLSIPVIDKRQARRYRRRGMLVQFIPWDTDAGRYGEPILIRVQPNA